MLIVMIYSGEAILIVMTYSGGPCIVEVVREDIEIPCSRVSIFGPKAGPDD
jgi:hypothetical protein